MTHLLFGKSPSPRGYRPRAFISFVKLASGTCVMIFENSLLLFPDLASGNIACKLLRKLGGAHTVGPILAGMKLPIHVLQKGCEVEDVVSIAALAAIDAERHPHGTRK